jgi:tRNA(Ile)-lysidine synthase
VKSSLHQHVRRTIRKHGLCPPGTRLIVGLSGGSDSTALALILIELAEHGQFGVASLAHLNHRLRPTADRDEQFCREFAARHRLGIVVEAADVQTFARTERLSIEDAARRLRYAFLERTAAALDASRIAVGHTEDDQAETFLLKLMRGAGLTGLAGIYPRRGRVIRPALECTRAELREYLRSRGESWVEDETNDDLDNPRNRVRHRVLPELDRAAGGATRPAIARAAGLIREDAEWLDQTAAERFAAVVTRTPDGLAIDAAGLTAAPPPIVRRVLLKALRQMAPDREIGLDHVETATALLGSGEGGVDVPGSRMELRRGKLVLIQQKVLAK